MAAGEREGTGFTEGQVVTVFRSRRRHQAEPDYQWVAHEMEVAARATVGFVDFKTFAAEDGEQVSLVTFATPAAQTAPGVTIPPIGPPNSRAAMTSTSTTPFRSDSAPTSTRWKRQPDSD